MSLRDLFDTIFCIIWAIWFFPIINGLFVWMDGLNALLTP